MNFTWKHWAVLLFVIAGLSFWLGWAIKPMPKTVQGSHPITIKVPSDTVYKDSIIHDTIFAPKDSLSEYVATFYPFFYADTQLHKFRMTAKFGYYGDFGYCTITQGDTTIFHQSPSTQLPPKASPPYWFCAFLAGSGMNYRKEFEGIDLLGIIGYKRIYFTGSTGAKPIERLDGDWQFHARVMVYYRLL